MIENWKKHNNIETADTIYYLRDAEDNTGGSDDKKKKCCSICRIF